MMIKKRLKNRLVKFVFGVFLMMIGMFGGACSVVLNSQAAYAVPGESETVEQGDEASGAMQTITDEIDCRDNLGAIGWFVCPATGKLAKATDYIYDKIEKMLVVDPVVAEDGSPIYEVWKYCRGLTNFAFIIFLLIVIYSQITGLGISNYGVKKLLPKLIIVAVLVNLSFLICVLLVDFSNAIGNGLRGVFLSISESAFVEGASGVGNGAGFYGTFVGSIGLALEAGIIAFESGAIWMLIPVLLGALVSVVAALVTIALRQAVVMLLVMVSPLAMVAYILPNTESLFKKWKDLLTRMLVFYPMFSLLFGASQLAGFAIITGAKDGLWLMLGVAVQIFPLFFSVKLMQMSGTFLDNVNTKLQGLAAKPLAANRAWADSHRMNTKQKFLASGRPTMPSLRLMQVLSNNRIRREAETGEYEELVKSRGLASGALSNYDRKGELSKHGQKSYERQARKLRYQQVVEMDKNNFSRGFGLDGLEDHKKTIAGMKKDFRLSAGVYSSKVKGKNLGERLETLDWANIDAADNLKFELARGAKIEYGNAKGFLKRTSDAMDAHFDQLAIDAGNENYQLHGVLGNSRNMERYIRMQKVMEGKEADIHFAAADAAYAFDAQSQIVRGRFQKYMDLTTPTQDVMNRLSEMTSNKNSSAYIDSVIAGLRTLNMRGDTDLLRRQVHEITKGGKLELGTYASQSLANFLISDVKDNDPFLRRFGKYINLETAKRFNEAAPGDRRTRKDVSLYEYVNGEYIDYDEEGNVIRDEYGNRKIRKPKKDAKVLLKGTSFNGMERTAMKDMIESIREYSVDINEDGSETFNYEKFKKNEGAIWNAIMPNIISDQFSFLSGSEQIVALGKGITGVDVGKHKFDWEGIFGEEAANLTPEQKKDYLKFVGDRTKTFLGGHVPMQIAKTKTDMLEAIRTQYALLTAIEKDPDFLEKLDNPDNKFGEGADDALGSYADLEREQMDGIRERFVGSFAEDALKGFLKMHHKGYQGEAKEKLIDLLRPDMLYQKYFSNSGESRRGDYDGDDGMPVESGMAPGGPVTRGVYNNARVAVEDIFTKYRGMSRGAQADVDGFWDAAKQAIRMSTNAQTGEWSGLIDQIEEAKGQFTTVDELYNYIMNTLFGGH